MTAHALVAHHRRALGATVLLALALAAWKFSALAAAQREARSPLDVGTPLPRVVTNMISDGEDPAPYPAVLLYVSESCPHCQAELARWDSLGATGAFVAPRPQVVVIVAPGPSSHWRPGITRFAHRVVRDSTLALARALRVRVVPTAFWVDRQGRIAQLTRGEQQPSAVMSRTRSLLEEAR